MSILNVYVKKEGKTTWIEMNTFPLINTTLPTKIKYLRLPVNQLQLKNIFLLKRLKVLR